MKKIISRYLQKYKKYKNIVNDMLSDIGKSTLLTELAAIVFFKVFF